MHHEWERSAYRVLACNPEGEKLLIKLRRRWEDNIKIGLKNRVGGCGQGFIWFGIGIRGRLM
jgi:hypothetical protein